MRFACRRILLAAALLFLAAPLARPQPAPSGIAQSTLAEVAAPAKLPPGVYTQAARWSATQFGHMTGTRLEDPDAQGGVAWTGEASLTATSGPLLYGPYAELPAADYVAFFRVKLAGDIGDESIATLDACVGNGASTLAQRDVSPADLARGRYVQVALAFRSPGGRLECRLHWQATTSLTVDGVTLYRREGPPVDSSVPMVEQPSSTGALKGLKYAPPRPPFEGIFPRSSKPSANLTVCDVRGKPADVQFLAVSLQGLVNRSTPRVYCLLNGEDPFWLDWLKKSNRVAETDTAADALALLEKYRGAAKGMIVTDPALPATRNVATMMAGVMDGAIVSPRLAAVVKLPVLADLRGRWKQNADAYQWAHDTLWPKLNHFAAACLWPSDAGLRDYLIQHRIPVFWLPGRIDAAKPYANAAAELKVAEEMFARMPANVPMMGYSWAGENIGMGEGPGVGLMAEFGKYLVGSPGLSNVSVHSGYPNPIRRQPAAKAPPMQQDKVYYSFLISDGDNLPVIEISNWPQLWRDPTRGKLPLAWTISPSSSILLPDIVDYYYSTASPNDTFMCAVSGVGYTYLQLYGKRYTQPSAVYDGFLDQTARYMKAMDLRTINPSGVSAKEIARYAERIPGLGGIFADYGKNVGTYQEATTVTSGNVPVFHAVTGWEPKGNREEQIANIVAQVKAITPATRPAFLHVFICNWFFDLPMLKEIQDRLGPDYVAVSPDNLAALCKHDMRRLALHVQAPVTVGGIEGRPVRYAVTLRNLTAKPMPLRLALHGAGSLLVSPAQMTLAPAQVLQAVVSGKASTRTVTLSVKGPFGARQYVTGVMLAGLREMIGTPPPASAHYEATFEAEALPHIVGDEVEEPTASGGKARAAVQGQTKPGHISYGPYRAYPAGKYVALFRVKRTGEGGGVACVLDATVAGAAKSLIERPVPASQLPLGEWKTVVLPFTHPGGSLETRAVWPGSVSLMIDRIDLYTVGK